MAHLNAGKIISAERLKAVQDHVQRVAAEDAAADEEEKKEDEELYMSWCVCMCVVYIIKNILSTCLFLVDQCAIARSAACIPVLDELDLDFDLDLDLALDLDLPLAFFLFLDRLRLRRPPRGGGGGPIPPSCPPPPPPFLVLGG